MSTDQIHIDQLKRHDDALILRVISYRPTTRFPDGQFLTYDGDPNDATNTTYGERVLNSAVDGTQYMTSLGVYYVKRPRSDGNGSYWGEVGITPEPAEPPPVITSVVIDTTLVAPRTEFTAGDTIQFTVTLDTDEEFTHLDFDQTGLTLAGGDAEAFTATNSRQFTATINETTPDQHIAGQLYAEKQLSFRIRNGANGQAENYITPLVDVVRTSDVVPSNVTATLQLPVNSTFLGEDSPGRAVLSSDEGTDVFTVGEVYADRGIINETITGTVLRFTTTAQDTDNNLVADSIRIVATRPSNGRTADTNLVVPVITTAPVMTRPLNDNYLSGDTFTIRYVGTVPFQNIDLPTAAPGTHVIENLTRADDDMSFTFDVTFDSTVTSGDITFTWPSTTLWGNGEALAPDTDVITLSGFRREVELQPYQKVMIDTGITWTDFNNIEYVWTTEERGAVTLVHEAAVDGYVAMVSAGGNIVVTIVDPLESSTTSTLTVIKTA